eukprot:7686888-Pyramimonas_sp.AAC.1
MRRQAKARPPRSRGPNGQLPRPDGGGAGGCRRGGLAGAGERGIGRPSATASKSQVARIAQRIAIPTSVEGTLPR